MKDPTCRWFIAGYNVVVGGGDGGGDGGVYGIWSFRDLPVHLHVRYLTF